MKRPIRALVTSALLVSCGALALTGCSGSSDSSASSSAHTTPADAKATGPVVIIDLRSAEEYKQGHLEGAVNYDFSSGDFSSQISGLDRNAQYGLARSQKRQPLQEMGEGNNLPGHVLGDRQSDDVGHPPQVLDHTIGLGHAQAAAVVAQP